MLGETLEGYANINLKSTSENADVWEAEARLLCETRETVFILQAELHLYRKILLEKLSQVWR